jgi:uncharacterized protein (DUF4415 family)
MPKSKANPSNVSTGPVSSIDPDDAPELTDQLLEYIAETAEYRHGDTVIARGRPPLGTFFKKATVTIRLDPDVVEAYRALGTGWQTRINDDLRKARKLGSKRRPA